MIEPQFRELVIPLMTLNFRLRFWISHETNLTPDQIGPAMLDLRKKIDEIDGGINDALPKDVEILIQSHFVPENRITAYEILDDRNVGVVGYVEWP